MKKCVWPARTDHGEHEQYRRYGDQPGEQTEGAKHTFFTRVFLRSSRVTPSIGSPLEKSVAIIKHKPHLGAKSRQMGSQEQHGSVLEAEKTRVKPPPLYKVILLNDDYTPMDFVVVVLQTVFGMSREKATQVMLQVHREGMGVCGTYTREVAVAKVDQVINLARKHQHPLQCTYEET